MSEPILYKGRGTPEMYDDLMDFLNYVFGFNGNQQDFKKLLPKLYKPEYNPTYANYVVTENGKLKAAIGAYDSTLQVGEEALKSRGIGNVAVHPYARSKGYMIDCMTMALSDMVKDGVDFSILGGLRQRYAYFGFEKSAPKYRIHLNKTNLRHCFRDVPLEKLELHPVEDSDTELLDQMYALHATRPERTLRPREAFPDILRSWQAEVVAILRNGTFIGYYVGSLSELTLVDKADLYAVVRNYVEVKGELDMVFAGWDRETFEAMFEICEDFSLGVCENISILNYQHVLSALLKFKASYTTLADGVITARIHGYARDEVLKISVTNGIPVVEDYQGECDFEFTHKEAMTFFLGIHSRHWNSMPAAIRDWFPLPLFVDSADQV